VKYLKSFNELNENKYQDAALDKIDKVGGFKNLPDIDKLALLSDSDNYAELKKINLSNIFRELGGTFGRLMIKVKIKDIKDQPIDHQFSKEFANKEGWLSSYINYSSEGEAYVTVRFDEFKPDTDMKGGGTYEDRPIMMDNIYPIEYNDTKPEFIEYQKRVEADRQKFMDDFSMLDDDK
jgi:hypothetical protein